MSLDISETICPSCGSRIRVQRRCAPGMVETTVLHVDPMDPACRWFMEVYVDQMREIDRQVAENSRGPLDC